VTIDTGRVCMGAYCATNAQLEGRVNLHVQSFSKWAPANIGPYSQGNTIKPNQNKVMLLAGSIGMNPGLMTLYGSVET